MMFTQSSTRRSGNRTLVGCSCLRGNSRTFDSNHYNVALCILSADMHGRPDLNISLAQNHSGVLSEPLYDPPTDSQASNRVVNPSLDPYRGFAKVKPF